MDIWKHENIKLLNLIDNIKMRAKNMLCAYITQHSADFGMGSNLGCYESLDVLYL